MKNTVQSVWLLLLVLLFNSGFAQYSLTPGKGFSQLYIGMQTADVIALLGQPETVTALADERTSWEEAGYNTRTELPYLLGFDEVHVFAPNPFLAWKMYMKKDRLVFMALTSYMDFEAGMKKIDIQETLHFGDSWETIVKILGPDFVARKRDADVSLNSYLKLGIALNMDENQLRTVFIFAPLTPKQAETIAKKMNP